MYYKDEIILYLETFKVESNEILISALWKSVVVLTIDYRKVIRKELQTVIKDSKRKERKRILEKEKMLELE